MSKRAQDKLTPIRLIEDQPVEDLDHDYLGLRPWATMIASAAVGTPGPFAIGVHGEWGYGKTTLLRLAKALIERHDKNAVAVWFNAWQYEREAHPLFPLIAAIADEIERKSRIADKMQAGLAKVGLSLRALARGMKFKAEVGMPLLGTVGAEFDADKALEAEELLGKQTNPLQGEMLYHSAFRTLEKEARADGKGERPKIVVFVDDLDRCQPEKAVSLLESIKLILSQPGFIFVIAVDRGVIENYLEKRYVEQCGEQTSGRGRLYMDKIVQLPIYIPSHRSRFPRFVESIITDLSKHHGESEAIVALRNTQQVLATGAATNPRSLIRLVNNFLLDCMLWPLIEHDPEYQELTDVIACALAFDRILQHELGDLYIHLVKSQELCGAILENGLDGVRKYIGPAEREEEMAAARPRRPTPGGALSSVARALEARPELISALQEHGSEWLANPDLRRVVHEFAQTERVEARATSFPEPLAQAIREALKLGPDEPVPANRLGEVTGVNLSGSRVADADLEHLKELSQLQALALNGTGITDAGLAHLRGLSQLRGIYLPGTRITGAGLAHLKGLSQLELLDLSATRVTDAALAHLKGLSRLREVYLGATRVTDAGLAHLKVLSQLQALELSGAGISDVGLEHLEGLSQLRELYLGGTGITDAGLAHLEGLSQLRVLHLGHTGITDAGLAHLEGLSQLEVLDLRDTGITDAGLADLKAKRPDMTIAR